MRSLLTNLVGQWCVPVRPHANTQKSKQANSYLFARAETTIRPNRSIRPIKSSENSACETRPAISMAPTNHHDTKSTESLSLPSG